MTLASDASLFHLLDPGIDRGSNHAFNHAPNEAWRAAQVESKSAQAESKADSIESAADEARPVADKWVAVYQLCHGYKRMVAYEAVSYLFRCSESQVRRLLGHQLDRLDADLYKRIMLSEPRADRLLAAHHEAEFRRLGGAPAGEARGAG